MGQKTKQAKDIVTKIVAKIAITVAPRVGMTPPKK